MMNLNILLVHVAVDGRCSKRSDIKKENKGYMDLLFVIYNNMVTLEESNPEVNKKIIYSLANLLQNQDLRLKDLNIDYSKELNKLTNQLYSIGE